MTVAVMFPDGTVRKVVGELKPEDGRFVQRPVNCDPLWKYVRRSGLWMAEGRLGQTYKTPLADRRSWWESITQMSDDVAADRYARVERRSVA